MFNLKKLLGLQSPLGDALNKELEMREKDELLKRVDFVYTKYKGLAEEASSLAESRELLKDLWLTIEMVMAHPEEEESGDMEMMNNGLRVQQQKESGSEEITSSEPTETIREGDAIADETKSDEPTLDPGITVFKDASGALRWLGIVSNNRTDRHGEILAQEAHLDFVKAVQTGEYPYPELWFHHDPNLVIGKSDYVNFDEQSGMLIASGTFAPEWQEIGENIGKSEYQWGMSHGMPVNEIVKDKKNKKIYRRYRSKEFSMLRVVKAASPLTSFS